MLFDLRERLEALRVLLRSSKEARAFRDFKAYVEGTRGSLGQPA